MSKFRYKKTNKGNFQNLAKFDLEKVSIVLVQKSWVAYVFSGKIFSLPASGWNRVEKYAVSGTIYPRKPLIDMELAGFALYFERKVEKKA